MFFNKIKAVYYTFIAKSHMNKRNYKDALLYINKINKKLIIDKGLYQCILFKAYSLFKIKHINKSLKSFEDSIAIIDKSYNRNSINENDRNYLKDFVFSIMKEIYEIENNLKGKEAMDNKIKHLYYDISKVKDKIFFDFQIGIGNKWINEYNKRKRNK